jgi:hypothetical protein
MMQVLKIALLNISWRVVVEWVGTSWVNDLGNE